MKWLFQNYFDPHVELDREQAWAAYRRANQFFEAQKRHVWTYVVATMTPTVLLLLWIFVGHRVFGWPPRWVRIGYAPAVLVLTYLAHSYVLRFIYAPHVRRAVREFGYDLCEKCGYWLRGLGEEIKRCPECGAERRPLADEEGN